MTCYIEQVVLLILLVLVGLTGLAATVSTFGPVTRARVQRFAHRQRLLVTAGNGNLVIAYLAATRRWRAAGLAAGVAICAAWSLRGSSFWVNFVAAFAGWFAGALVAEVRMVRQAPAQRRQASLAPRRLEAYLGWFSRRLLVATVVVSVAGTVIALDLAHQIGRSWLPVLAWFALAILIAVLVWMTQVRVLRRPQPLAEPDVLAADDAIRSRSLHVLAGGGAALVLYCVCAQLAALGLALGDPGYQAVTVVNGFALFLVPALGWNVATWAWRVRRPAVAALT
jgi:hypothetical protein